MLETYAQVQDCAREERIPFDVMVELTYGCNLRCAHCYNAPDGSQREISAEEFAGILGQIAAAGGFMLTFTGGEALTRPDFFEIAARAKRLGYAMSLISNGTLITDDVADRLAALHFADVSVTLYSTDPETHDSITRTPGSQRATVGAIERLRSRGIKVSMRSVIMRKNFQGYEALIRFAEERGIRYLIDPNVSVRQDGDRSPLKYQLDAESMVPIYADRRINFSLEGFPREDSPQPDCDAGRSICSVDPYGNLYPCIQLPIKFGNMLEEPFDRIWNESEEARRLRGINRRQMAECLGCKLSGYCMRCTGVAYLEGHGLVGRSDSACATAKIMAGLVENEGAERTGKRS
ncbi:MAG: radical SAM protein [bacterium]